MIGPELEAPRPPTGPDFVDAVAFAAFDLDRELCVGARVELAGGAARAGAVLLRAGGTGADGGGGVAGATVAGAISTAQAVAGEDPAPAEWSAPEAGVRAETLVPLGAWRLAVANGAVGCDLRFEALGETPVDLGPPAGPQGYVHACRVSGAVTVDGVAQDLAGLGTRSHVWGPPAWRRVAASRSASAWLGEDLGVTVVATRPRDAAGHEADAVAAWVVEEGVPVAVGEPRLSSALDGVGAVRRLGLELWPEDEEARARRVAGEALGAATLELGDRRAEWTFLRWRMEGRVGLGHHELLLPA